MGQIKEVEKAALGGCCHGGVAEVMMRLAA